MEFLDIKQPNSVATIQGYFGTKNFNCCCNDSVNVGILNYYQNEVKILMEKIAIENEIIKIIF